MLLRILIFFLLIVSLPLFAQNNSKIEKKLSKLYNNGKYQKCHDKALNINKKQPKSTVPEYYLAKVNIHWYSQALKTGRTRYNNLIKAVKYSDKLPETYFGFKKSVQDSLRLYVILMHDNAPEQRQFKVAYAFYTKIYQDTLDFFYDEIPSSPTYKFAKTTIDSL